MMSWTYVTLFFVCLVASAFFAACETALMSVSLSAWDRLRENHRRVRAAYGLWTENSSLVIATLLFGNTLTSMGASVVASSLGSHIADYYHWSPATTLFLTSVFAGSTILIFGDILPKLYARHAHERVLLWSAGAIASVTIFLRPILKGLALLSDILRRILFFIPVEPLITREEMNHVFATPHIEGLEPTARLILSNIMAFEQVKVREVMIPQNQIIAVRLEQNVERTFEHIVRSGFSRVPVYFGNIDNILGIVYAKDLLVEWRSSGLLVLEDLLRPPYRIAPDAPLSVLLQGFRQGHHMAVVTDSRGRTLGLVTVEDVVEAIVGDIADEFDQPL